MTYFDSLLKRSVLVLCAGRHLVSQRHPSSARLYVATAEKTHLRACVGKHFVPQHRPTCAGIHGF